jgi:ribose transport system permease protein
VLLIGLIALLQIDPAGHPEPALGENLIRFAIPLAMLAACQTLTMLTGGIDLSAGTAATVSAFVVATQTPIHGPWIAHADRAGACDPDRGRERDRDRDHAGASAHHDARHRASSPHRVPAGLPAHRDRLGLGRCRSSSAGSGRADVDHPERGVPVRAAGGAIIFMLRRTGFGRLLYALGENENAARLSGVRSWQVYLALYTLSGLLAGITGLVYVGLIKAPSLSLVEPRLCRRWRRR